MAKTKITGLEQLERKLFQLPDAAKKRIRKAMEKAANDIVSLSKKLAPVGGSPTSYGGSNTPYALRNSIGWTWGRPPKGSITIAKVSGGSGFDNDLVITIYAGNKDAFWARWVEFGTQSHTIRRHGPGTMKRGAYNFGKVVEHPGATATPFFYPAYRAYRKNIKQRIMYAIRQSIKDVARGK